LETTPPETPLGDNPPAPTRGSDLTLTDSRGGNYLKTDTNHMPDPKTN